MELLTKMQIMAVQELYCSAVKYKNGRMTEGELHTALRCLSMALATECWSEGKHTVQKIVQIAGICTDDMELRKVYQKIMDDIFEY